MSKFADRPAQGLALALTVLVLASCGAEPAPDAAAAERAAPAVVASTDAVANAAPAAGEPVSIAAVSDAVINVYMSPTCGCCGKWVDHLRESGFAVEVTEVEDVLPVKTRLGIDRQLSSCHTATVGDYVIEGHVPAADIARMIEEKPQIAGITVPGMPMGSPGMEGPRSERYDVLAIHRNGSTSVYASH